MIKHGLIISALFLIGCGSNSEKEANLQTGTFNEIAPSKAEMDEIELEKQPELIQDFFAVDSSFFGTDFCYSYSQIFELVVHQHGDLSHWHEYMVDEKENQLSMHNDNCIANLDFKTFRVDEKKYAYLSQIGRTSEQFNFLVWNEQQQNWRKSSTFPTFKNDAFFDNLSAEETALINEHGAHFHYISENNNITVVFSDWVTHQNLLSAKSSMFEHEVAYYFQVSFTAEGFVTKKIKTENALSE